MERKIISLALLLLPLTFGYAQVVSHNMDSKTIAAVGEMTAAQVAIETEHNNIIDSVNSKKKAIAAYTTTMAAIKNLYCISMQNIDGFGQETAMYQEIVMHAAQIMTKLPVALNELRKRPTSMVLTFSRMTDIGLHAKSAINTFVNVVNNGRISIKAQDLKIEGSNDGMNMLNRSDRYVLANSVLSDLRDISWKLDAIIYIARFCNSFSDYLLTLDSQTWCTLYTGVNYTNTIIQMYRQL